ncbi:MAG: HAD family phosphatase [Actinobacteria bacterium]|nr:HAD family phosphatase [Actinomycetota bacterium]
MKNKGIKEFKLFSDYKKAIKEELKDNLRVIYTDLDGTLLNDRGCLIKDNENSFFTDSIDLIHKAEKKGWDTVIVSGRSRDQLRTSAMLMGLKNYISELGCEIVYNLGKEVHATFDTGSFNYEITKGGKDLVKIIKILKEAFPGKIESRIEWSLNRSYNALFVGEIDIDMANEMLNNNGYGGLILANNGFSKMFDAGLDVNNLIIYNLMPSGVDKSTGIRADKKTRRINSGNCIALGDSAEDIKMAKEVSAFFLMRDSLEKNPQIQDLIKNYDNIYITEEKMNRGWVEVIKYLAD